MAKFKIDDIEYDTDKLDNKQKRVIALYQKAVQEEAEAIASLEVKRAGRIEIGRKLKELVNQTKSQGITFLVVFL